MLNFSGFWQYGFNATSYTPTYTSVIAYNRSGFAQGDGNGLDDGNISFLARAYDLSGNFLVQAEEEMLLRVSPISDYHCGTRAGPNMCHQRWGYPGAVTIDPGDHHRFYAIGASTRPIGPHSRQVMYAPFGAPTSPKSP